MIYGLYCIFDTVAGNYLAPSPAVNDSVAIRNFATNFANEKDVMALNAADFKLCKVGEFDPIKGEIIHCDTTVVIDGISARNLIER